MEKYSSWYFFSHFKGFLDLWFTTLANYSRQIEAFIEQISTEHHLGNLEAANVCFIFVACFWGGGGGGGGGFQYAN